MRFLLRSLFPVVAASKRSSLVVGRQAGPLVVTGGRSHHILLFHSVSKDSYIPFPLISFRHIEWKGAGLSPLSVLSPFHDGKRRLGGFCGNEGTCLRSDYGDPSYINNLCKRCWAAMSDDSSRASSAQSSKLCTLPLDAGQVVLFGHWTEGHHRGTVLLLQSSRLLIVGGEASWYLDMSNEIGETDFMCFTSKRRRTLA